MSSVTGHYRLRDPATPNSLEVLKLPNGKIRFHLFGLWISTHNREKVHHGELAAVIELKDNTATFETEGCKVTIRFFSTTAIVTRDRKIGDCDFGANVTASGTYQKINTRKPKFDTHSLMTSATISEKPLCSSAPDASARRRDHELICWREHA